MWILGRKGLLGSAVCRLENPTVQFQENQISWANQDNFERTFFPAVAEFFNSVIKRKSPWVIYWCAGVGTPSRGGDAFSLEVAAVEHLARVIRNCPAEIAKIGTVFFSSSAGGVYGGALSHPIDESLSPSPLSEYGHMKIELEEQLQMMAEISGCRLALGRFSNVYGPGQNFRKSQGLITQACISVVAKHPLEIYVPLGTVRNYIYVEDAARIAIALTQFVANQPPSTVLTKLICSDANLSISAVLYEVARIFGRRPPVVLTSPKRMSRHTLDLSMKSNVLKNLEPTNFALPSIGIAKVRQDLMLTVREGKANQFRSSS